MLGVGLVCEMWPGGWRFGPAGQARGGDGFGVLKLRFFWRTGEGWDREQECGGIDSCLLSKQVVR